MPSPTMKAILSDSPQPVESHAVHTTPTESSGTPVDSSMDVNLKRVGGEMQYDNRNKCIALDSDVANVDSIIESSKLIDENILLVRDSENNLDRPESSSIYVEPKSLVLASDSRPDRVKPSWSTVSSKSVVQEVQCDNVKTSLADNVPRKPVTGPGHRKRAYGHSQKKDSIDSDESSSALCHVNIPDSSMTMDSESKSDIVKEHKSLLLNDGACRSNIDKGVLHEVKENGPVDMERSIAKSADSIEQSYHSLQLYTQIIKDSSSLVCATLSYRIL